VEGEDRPVRQGFGPVRHALVTEHQEQRDRAAQLRLVCGCKVRCWVGRHAARRAACGLPVCGWEAGKHKAEVMAVLFMR